MASNDDDPNDFVPRLRLRDENAPPPIPDNVENVERETEGIFRSFMFQSYQMEMNTDDIEQIEQTPSLPELTNFSVNPMSQASDIGRQLAIIGDDINERHKRTFDFMIRQLKVKGPEIAYEAFARIARRLFDDEINWGRIITLLVFGYRMAVNVLTKGVRGFFAKIVSFVVDFIVKEKISKWIADHGGWIASLRYVPESIGPGTLVTIGVLAFITIGVAVWFSKR